MLNVARLYRCHEHLTEIWSYSNCYEFCCININIRIQMPSENEESNLQHSLYFTKEHVAVFHANQSTAPPGFFLFSSKVPTQNTDSLLWQKPCVAERIKMSRYPFNRSLFLRLVSVFLPQTLVQICTPTVPICFIYFSIFIFANVLLFYQSSGINYDTEINWCCLFLVM